MRVTLGIHTIVLHLAIAAVCSPVFGQDTSNPERLDFDLDSAWAKFERAVRAEITQRHLISEANEVLKRQGSPSIQQFHEALREKGWTTTRAGYSNYNFFSLIGDQEWAHHPEQTIPLIAGYEAFARDMGTGESVWRLRLDLNGSTGLALLNRIDPNNESAKLKLDLAREALRIEKASPNAVPTLAVIRRSLLENLDNKIADGQRWRTEPRLQEYTRQADQLMQNRVPAILKSIDTFGGASTLELMERGKKLPTEEARAAFLDVIEHASTDLSLTPDQQRNLLERVLSAEEPLHNVEQHRYIVQWALSQLLAEGDKNDKLAKQMAAVTAGEFADEVEAKTVRGTATRSLHADLPEALIPLSLKELRRLSAIRDQLRERTKTKETLIGSFAEQLSESRRTNPKAFYTRSGLGIMGAGLGVFGAASVGVQIAKKRAESRRASSRLAHQDRLENDVLYRTKHITSEGAQTCHEAFRLTANEAPYRKELEPFESPEDPRKVARESLRKTMVTPFLEREVIPTIEKLEATNEARLLKTKGQKDPLWFANPKELSRTSPATTVLSGRPQLVYETPKGEAYYFDQVTGEPRFALIPSEHALAIPTFDLDGNHNGWKRRYYVPSLDPAVPNSYGRLIAFGSMFLSPRKEQPPEMSTILELLQQQDAGAFKRAVHSTNSSLQPPPATAKSRGALRAAGEDFEMLEDGLGRAWLVNNQGATVATLDLSKRLVSMSSGADDANRLKYRFTSAGFLREASSSPRQTTNRSADLQRARHFKRKVSQASTAVVSLVPEGSLFVGGLTFQKTRKGNNHFVTSGLNQLIGYSQENGGALFAPIEIAPGDKSWMPVTVPRRSTHPQLLEDEHALDDIFEP